MKTTINKNATVLDVTIFVPIQALETEGWDFDNYHQEAADAMDLSIEAAADYNYNNYVAELRVTGSAETPLVSVAWYNQDRNETTEFEDSGDNERAIKDIINLLDSGQIVIHDNDDRSVNADECYVSAFEELTVS